MDNKYFYIYHSPICKFKTAYGPRAEFVQADVITRYQKLLGKELFLILVRMNTAKDL